MRVGNYTIKKCKHEKSQKIDFHRDTHTVIEIAFFDFCAWTNHEYQNQKTKARFYSQPTMA